MSVLLSLAALGAACSRREEPVAERRPAAPATTSPAPAAVPAAALTITDDMGRTVTIPAGVSRITALVPFAADMLLDLGVTPVAVPAIRGGGPASWKSIPTVAVDHGAGPNLEQIAASKPDLIIATTVYAPFLPQVESATNAPVVVLDITSLDDVARHTRTLGAICGRSVQAEAAALKVEQSVRDVSGASAGNSARVLAIFGTPHAFYGFLPESYLGDLVKRCNGQLVTEGLVSHKVFQGLAPLGMEAIIARDPEVILVVFHGPSEIATAMLAKDPAWNTLRAVKAGRVHVLTDELFVMHPGVRPAEALGQIASALRSTPTPATGP